NQLREKVGVMYGNPETTTGGRALKFYSTIRIEIRRSETIKQGDKALGNIVNVKVVKNKVAPPYRSCKVELMFGEGVSKDHEVAQLAVDYSIIEKSGSWFSYQGERLGQGITSVYDWLKNNPDMQVKIEEEVRARLSGKTPETDAE
ncbi:MAG: hypothetical protein K5762_01030, partial [Bacilli bacterium]|nr:hypothetical protein [Bacilli bacterium]